MYELNYRDLYEININPSGVAEYATLAKGIIGATQSNNDVTDKTTYLDGGGYGSSDVTGAQKTIPMTGHRVVGDKAQDYIAGLIEDGILGDGRKTDLRYRNSLGGGFNIPITILDIEVGGGDANAKKDISFSLDGNGKPTKVAKSLVSTLDVTITAGTTTGTTKATITPTAGNTLAYKLSSASQGSIYLNQYLEGAIDYTSAEEITAAVGQILTLFELDSNGRVVNSNSATLAIGDIA